LLKDSAGEAGGQFAALVEPAGPCRTHGRRRRATRC